MNNKIKFKIYSIDGKSFEEEIDAIYLDVPNHGIIGLLKGHTPYGGTINFKNNEAILLAQTYEKEDELDKARIEKVRDEAINLLSKIDKNDQVAYDNASFTLKKAINRLKILK